MTPGAHSMDVEQGRVHCHALVEEVSPSHAGLLRSTMIPKPAGTLNIDFLQGP